MDRELAVQGHSQIIRGLISGVELGDNVLVEVCRKELLRRLVNPNFITKKMLAKITGRNENTVRSKIDRAIRSRRLIKGIGFVKIGETVLVRKDKGLSIISESKTGRPKCPDE